MTLTTPVPFVREFMSMYSYAPRGKLPSPKRS
jgi:hypothetical protein